MKSYVILGCIVVLAIASPVKSNEGYHKFLVSIPADIQTKCFEEADLVADKDKVLSDETKVDPTKLSCYTACAFREGGIMSNGVISYDALEKLMDKIFAGDPNIEKRKDSMKGCIEEATGATDCEKVANLTTCALKKLAENGLK